jgi:iron complex outermembrane receptor protein
MMYLKSVRAFLAVSTAMAVAYPAAAQDTVAQDGGASAADIIVTARRTEERLQDVPISITVFNQQQLTNKNITKAEDLAIYTPSLSQNNTLGSTASSFAIRGFVQDIGTLPSVGVYFAEVTAPMGASNNQSVGNGAGPGAFFDLQNVQVLKGPQGTLFGRNTTGGSILLVPQKPTGKFEGYVEGTLGNYNARRIQAVVNVPLSDTVRFRMGVDRSTRDGYVKNYSPVGAGDYYDQDYVALRASLVADLTSNLENYTIATYSNVHQNGEPQKVADVNTSVLSGPAALAFPFAVFGANQQQRLAAAGAGFYSTEINFDNPYVKQETWQLINNTTWRVSDNLTVKNIVSYAQLVADNHVPVFGYAPNMAELNAYLPFPIFASPSPVNTVFSQAAPGAKTAQQSTFTEELQFQGNALDNRLTWQAGGYLSLSDPLGLSGSYSTILLSCPDSPTVCSNPFRGLAQLSNPAATSPFGTRTVGRTWFRTTALYGQATYSLSDQFKLTGGFRYTWDTVRGQGQLQSVIYAATRTSPIPPWTFVPGAPTGVACAASDLVAPDCNVAAEQKSSAPTWLIDLDWTPTQDVLLYAKYARGYRSGGVALQVPNPYRTFQPEKVDSYEIGAKTSFHGAISGTFNVAGFYNDFSNQQLLLSITRNGDPAPQTGILNAGQSRIWGVEVETVLRLFKGFDISGGYTYLNTKLTSVAAPQNTPELTFRTPIQSGDPLTFTPAHKLSGTASYTLPLEGDIGQITLSATYSYQSKMYTGYNSRDAAGNIVYPSVVPGRGLLDLNLNWRDIGGRPLDLGLFANNVTNKEYYNVTLDNFTAPGQGAVTGTVGLPRMYGARLRYRFGG